MDTGRNIDNEYKGPRFWPGAARVAARAAGALGGVGAQLLADWLPPICACCGETGLAASSAGAQICAGCVVGLPGLHARRCVQCAMPLADTGAPATVAKEPGLSEQPRCAACRRNNPHFDVTIAALDYRPPVDALLIALKAGGRISLARPAARLLHAAILGACSVIPPDLILAVPLAPERLADRGYNQALAIARPIARAMRLPLPIGMLRRVRDTASQKVLDAPARRHNLKGAFTVSPAQPPLLAGKTVGVVDDIMTTGATLEEIARTLKAAGAARVINLVVARTP